MHVHEWIVCDIERIGNIAEELAQLRAYRIGGAAACSDEHDDREYQQDGYCLIDAVRNAILASDAWNGEDHNENERCPPEAAFELDRAACRIAGTDAVAKDAREHETTEEWIEQSGKTDVELIGCDAPSALNVILWCTEESAHIPAESEVEREECCNGNEYSQTPFWQMTEYENVEDIGNVLEGERPVWTVERVELLPAADIETWSARYHEKTHDEAEPELPCWYGEHHREGLRAEIVHTCTYHCAHDDHRVKTYEAALEEAPGGHSVPTIVVGITDDETGEDKEEIDSEIAVIDMLLAAPWCVGFEQVEQYNKYCGYTAESVKDLISRLGCEVFGCLHFMI